MDEVKKKFVDTRLSKLVVYDNNLDHVTGYIHQLDLFKNPAAIKSILHPIPAVPESMSGATGSDQQIQPGKKEHRLGRG